MQLVGEKQGRVSKDPNHSKNVDFILKHYGKNIDASNRSNVIKNTREKFMKAIEQHDKELLKDLEDDSLEYLQKFIDKHGVRVASKRKSEWRDIEKDVALGMQKLIDDGVFVYIDKKGVEHPVSADRFECRVAGGASLSDVRITNLKKKLDVYVECKKDFMTSEFLKFGLNVQDGRLKYDHAFHLRALDADEKAKINELFEKDIDLSGFLNSIVQSPQVKKFWDEFLKNLDSIQKAVQQDEDFKQFARGVDFSRQFPQNADSILKVFDLYVAHYIQRYDSLVDQILDSYEGRMLLQRDEYTISDIRDATIDDVFYAVNQLMGAFYQWNDYQDSLGGEQYHIDKEKMIALSDELKTIEVKLTKIMDKARLSKPHDLLKMSQGDKLRYFFAAFVSSVGRKKNDKHGLVGATQDELGNMQVCPPIDVEDRKLAEIICKYYVKKDHCVYMQIGDQVYSLAVGYNLFNLPGLPCFLDELNKFVVTLVVKDDLSKIQLHIRAIDPKLAGRFDLVSFRQKDLHYIGKKFKRIEIYG